MPPTTFTVATRDLTEDLLTARPGLGPRPIGKLEASHLQLVLEKALRAEFADAAALPQLVIETVAGTFAVRITRDGLELRKPDGSPAAPVQHDAAAIVQEIARSAGLPVEPATPPTDVRARVRRAIAVLLLLFAVAILAYTSFTATRVDAIDENPVVQLVTDEREQVALRNSAVGRYATGSQPGDRRIEVSADGQIRFVRIVEGGERPESDDSYRIGRIDGKLCLSTNESGLVQIMNIDTLVYWNDVYRRTR